MHPPDIRLNRNIFRLSVKFSKKRTSDDLLEVRCTLNPQHIELNHQDWSCTDFWKYIYSTDFTNSSKIGCFCNPSSPSAAPLSNPIPCQLMRDIDNIDTPASCFPIHNLLISPQIALHSFNFISSSIAVKVRLFRF